MSLTKARTMSFTEPGRHRLHHALEQALGPDEANTLMANLPPFAWTDIATKADLNALRDDLSRHFDASITEFRGEMHMKFAAMDEKFTQRFSAVDSRFSQVDSKLAAMDSRISQVDSKLAAMDSKLAAMEERSAERFAGVDAKFAAMEERSAGFDAQFAGIAARFTSTDFEIDKLRSEMHVGFAELRSEMHRNSFIIVGGLGSLMALFAAATNLFG